MRCSVTRPSFRCATRCLMARYSWLVSGNVERATRNSQLGESEQRVPSDEYRRLLLRRGGASIDTHAEAEAHRVQNLLDLIQALAPEVLRLEHLRLGLVHELAEGANGRVFQ